MKPRSGVSWSRRRVLKSGAMVAGGLAAALVTRRGFGEESAGSPGAKRIALSNLHTGERVDVEYFRAGDYVADALAKIETVLRDFRNGERHAIDPRLMDYLVDVAAGAGVKASFSVISGYRSPQTNERLHEKSSGVAEHSLHMQGRAIDVRVNGVDCADLAARALDLKRGGVGYYRASNFVHLDTGAFRTWRG
jgi:uncharacterized protein YcbK (DUF882 family)